MGSIHNLEIKVSFHLRTFFLLRRLTKSQLVQTVEDVQKEESEYHTPQQSTRSVIIES